MALSVDTTFRNSCGYRLWNTAYASLVSYQSLLVDDIGAQVLTRLKEYAEFISMPSGGNAAPDEWMPWFIAEAVWEISITTHPERAKVFKTIAADAKVTALTAFSRELNDYDPSVNTVAFVFTFQNLRHHLVNHAVRQKPMLMPGFSTVDAAIDWAMKWVWNKSAWTYKRRQVAFTINADSTVTFTLDNNEEFDSLASFSIYYTDTAGIGETVKWVDSDTMAESKSWDGTTTGRPCLYRMEATGDSVEWHWSPAPDAAYTARAEVLVRTPATPDDEDDTVPFSRFASDHLPHMRDLALAKLLYDHNSPDPSTARAKFDEVCARIDADFAKYQSLAEGDGRGSVGDVFQDHYHLPTGTVFGGGM